jgi:hypothetical protein
MPFHRRKNVRIEINIGESFPEPPPKKPPINILQQALTVKSYMTEHPDETCLSASAKINVHRKRIAKLMTILDNLPKEFIEKYKECDDPKILHRMVVKPLYQIASNPCPNRIPAPEGGPPGGGGGEPAVRRPCSLVTSADSYR